MRVTHCLVRAATVSADRIATIDGDRRRTWREVRTRVARIAGALQGLGLESGERIAVLANNCDAFFEAYYAIPWAGAVIVPMNTRLATVELDFQLRDAGVRKLFYGREYAEVAGALLAAGAVETLIGLDAADGLEALAERGPEMAETETDPLTIAGIFYTGGTTGLPKGVMLSHRNLYAMATNLVMQIPFTADDVNFHSAPMFHLADIGLFFATLAGGTHVFRRSWDADAMLETIAAHGVTHCFTVPAIIDRMTKSTLRAGLDLSSLRYLGYGGSSMPAATMAAARAAFPEVSFIQGFGQTEFPAATFLSPAAHRLPPEADKLKSCGQVCFGYEIRIVGDDGNEVPRGTVGEIVGRGDNVMLGYWNRPEETAEVLRGGWVHTRDAGYMDEDGYIYITDRLKDMIVSGAENVYSIEVENALSWHPAVEESAVIGLPDPAWGERVHAIVVLKSGVSQPADAELAEFCRTRIARYKVPKSFSFRAQPLPRSAAGKIVKGPLREELAGG